tara:strand:- start:452 stop:640 length:189 start_codon:yes stop_codon:yes gene_type:complete
VTSAVLKKLFIEYMKRYRKGLAKHYTALDSPKELERLRGLARDMFGTGMTSGGIKTLLDLLG